MRPNPDTKHSAQPIVYLSCNNSFCIVFAIFSFNIWLAIIVFTRPGASSQIVLEFLYAFYILKIFIHYFNPSRHLNIQTLQVFTYRCTLAEFILGLSNEAQKKAVVTSFAPVYAVLLDTLFLRAEVNINITFFQWQSHLFSKCFPSKGVKIMLMKEFLKC